MQVQNSKYIKIDEDFVDHAARVKKEFENETGMSKFQQEQRLFEILGEVHVKYLHESHLAKTRKNSIQVKNFFSQ